MNRSALIWVRLLKAFLLKEFHLQSYIIIVYNSCIIILHANLIINLFKVNLEKKFIFVLIAYILCLGKFFETVECLCCIFVFYSRLLNKFLYEIMRNINGIL